jgi:N-acetylmuramoyl-L-alanine amidase
MRRRRRSNNFGKFILLGLAIALVVLLIGISFRKDTSVELTQTIAAMNSDNNAYVQWTVSENQLDNLNDLYILDKIKKQKNDVSNIEKIDLIEKNGITQYVIYTSSPITNVNLDKTDNILDIEFTKVSFEQIKEYPKVVEGLIDNVELSTKGKNNSLLKIELANSEIQGTMNLSEDRKIVTINILENYIYGLTVGNDKEGDYIQLETVWEPSIEILEEKMNSSLLLCLPYTNTDLKIESSNLGDNILSIVNEKNKNLLTIKLELKSIPDYEVKVKGNKVTIRLKQKEKTEDAVKPGEFGLIVIKKSEGISLKNLTENADIIKKQLEISFDKKIDKQDIYYADGYEYKIVTTKNKQIIVNQVINRSNAGRNIAVSNNGEETRFTMIFDNYLEYIYSEDKDYIYIKPVTPREKYDKIVVIDPGHGGVSSPGAVYNNVIEQAVNLSYAMKLKKLTDAQEKIKFYYLRFEDIDVSLDDRIAISNGINPDMFISMHCNANDYSYVKGTEVYYSTTLPDSDKLSGEDLAKLVYDDLAKNLDSPGRGALETEDYRVVIKASVPAILIELGYMTNDSDLKRLSDEEFLKKAADSLYNSILTVYDTYEMR